MSFEDAMKKVVKSIDELTEALIERKDQLEEEEEECSILDSIGEEYNEFLTWCFGKEDGIFKKSQMIEKWAKKHPNLPVPRVFLTEESPCRTMAMAFLMIDAYPLFLRA